MKKITFTKLIAASTIAIGSAAFAENTPASSAASVAFDSLKSQATEMIGYAWPLAVLVTGSIIGIKLFKKFVNRAS